MRNAVFRPNKKVDSLLIPLIIEGGVLITPFYLWRKENLCVVVHQISIFMEEEKE